jgi:hypothetical protein
MKRYSERRVRFQARMLRDTGGIQGNENENGAENAGGVRERQRGTVK